MWGSALGASKRKETHKKILKKKLRGGGTENPSFKKKKKKRDFFFGSCTDLVVPFTEVLYFTAAMVAFKNCPHQLLFLLRAGCIGERTVTVRQQTPVG